MPIRLLILLLSCLPAFLSGCASPQTTRLQVEDFNDMAAAMAQSLLRSDALVSRTPGSEPWVVSMQDVTNLSGDVIPEREQWALMAMIQSAPPITELWRERNVRFVLPAEQTRRYRLQADRPEMAGFGQERAPTHVLTATIRSAPRAQQKRRTDLYYAQFEIIDLARGTPAWQDTFEFKRNATGDLRD